MKILLLLLSLISSASGLFYPRFSNPPGSLVPNGRLGELAKLISRRFRQERPKIDVPDSHVIPEKKALAELTALKKFDTITWLGHACFLIRLNGTTILTDPYLTTTAGPFGIGPKRYVPPGISIKYLPKIDIIIVSHNHYDSLDLNTIKQLKDKQDITVIVPLKMGNYFRRHGYTNIYALNWHQSKTIDNIKITIMPAVHFSGRNIFDRNYALWGGFAIKDKDHNIYFSGDTAAHPTLFKEIGKKYGPFDLGILGIGAYIPQGVMKYSHSTPEDAVKIGQEVNAKTILGMHWGTVVLSEEPQFEPPIKFKKAAEKEGYSKNHAWIMRIGETKKIP